MFQISIPGPESVDPHDNSGSRYLIIKVHQFLQTTNESL